MMYHGTTIVHVAARRQTKLLQVTVSAASKGPQVQALLFQRMLRKSTLSVTIIVPVCAHLTTDALASGGYHCSGMSAFLHVMVLQTSPVSNHLKTEASEKTMKGLAGKASEARVQGFQAHGC